MKQKIIIKKLKRIIQIIYGHDAIAVTIGLYPNIIDDHPCYVTITDEQY